MLLDQKRTKRIVKITAILTSLAFAGVAVVIILVIVLGGTPSATEQALSSARERVEAEPDNALAWDRLSAALDADGKPDEAIAAGKKAVALAPRDFNRTANLAGVYRRYGRNAEAVALLQAYTKRNPDDPRGFLELGDLADTEGRVVLARLSYQQYLALDPEGSAAAGVRERLKQLQSPTAPTTTTAP